MRWERAMVQPTLGNLPQILLYWCACFCPEFALLLSIWHNSGWSGLPLHWGAAVPAARRMGSGRTGQRVTA
jgi:hypothetical protein